MEGNVGALYRPAVDDCALCEECKRICTIAVEVYALILVKCEKITVVQRTWPQCALRIRGARWTNDSRNEHVDHAADATAA